MEEEIKNKLCNVIISSIPQLWIKLKKNVLFIFRRGKTFYDLERKFIKENDAIVSEEEKMELVKITSDFLKRRKMLPIILFNLSKLRKMSMREELDFIECFDLLHKVKFYREDDIFMNINSLNNEWRNIVEKHRKIEGKITKKMMEKNIFNEYTYVDINDKKLNKDINLYEAYINYWEKSNSWINKQMQGYRRRKNGSLTILDAGCGSGRIIKELAEQGDEVFLVEPDNERLVEAFEVLKENGIKNVHRFNVCIEQFDDSYCKADIIICSHVIQHVSMDAIKMILAKFRSCLKDNGILFLLLPLSYSDYSEFVVHGLEFDIRKIRKDMYDSYNDVIKLLEKEGYSIPSNYYIKAKDNYKDLCVDDNVYYSVSKRENCTLIYKRIYNQGLLFSVEKMNDINRQFDVFNEKIREYLQMESDLIYFPTNFSRYYLLSDNKGNKCLLVKNVKTNSVEIFKETCSIPYHAIYEDLLNKKKIPIALLKALVLKQREIELSLFQKNYWQVKNRKTQLIIAVIIKTQNYFSIAAYGTCLEKKIDNRCDYITETLKILPGFGIVDTEVSEGYWGKDENSEVKIFMRNDPDWYRAFARTNELSPYVLLNIIKNGERLIGDERIRCEIIIENKIWRIIPDDKSKSQNRVLPYYVVIANDEVSEDYFVYRDKRYNRISENTFDLLCTKEQQIRYKILPTHHFLYKELKKELALNKFRISHLYSYHLNKRNSWIDRLVYRDSWFNFLKLGRFKMFRRKVQARDCLMVIKKRKPFLDRIRKVVIDCFIR